MDRARGLRIAWRTVPLIAFGVLAVRVIPAWPDDWDGLGFVASIDRFDLDHFAPHPPGYPVYVALLKLAALLVRDHVFAAGLVSVAATLATFALVQSLGARLRDESTGLFAGAAVILTPLAWRAGTGVGSEAVALTFAALAAWAIGRKNGVLLGIAVGLGLGVRLSWAPFYLPLLALAPQGQRTRAFAGLAAGSLAWLVPFVALVGPSHLAALERAHVVGHATQWGGTVVTEPGLARFVWLFRDVFVDGFGGGVDILGFVVGTTLAIVLLVLFSEWRKARFVGLARGALVLLPYTAWILLFQNVHVQPRHALPIIATLSFAIAYGGTRPHRVRGLSAVLLAIIAFRSARDAGDRRSIPPAGEQLAVWMQTQDRSVVFGNASERFFESTPMASRGRLAGSIGDTEVAMGRLPELPDHVYVTSELTGLDAVVPPPPPVAVFCRPERVDRKMPCITVYELDSRADR